MKTKTGLKALALFALTTVVTISCGGTSDDGNTTNNNAGSGTTAGSSTGGSSTAGSSSSAGTTNNTAGTDSTAGTGNNTAGTGNNNGGSANGGTGNNAGGDGNNDPGAGGDGPAGCPASQPAPNTACMRGDGGFMGCTYGDQTCRCQRMQGGGQNGMRTWVCTDANPGAGGDNGGFGQATCPANAQDGDTCTNGPGICTGQACFCNQQGEVNCF